MGTSTFNWNKLNPSLPNITQYCDLALKLFGQIFEK